jgi:hypothetical protein
MDADPLFDTSFEEFEAMAERELSDEERAEIMASMEQLLLAEMQRAEGTSDSVCVESSR